MELLCGYPSIRFAPRPARGRKAFNRFLQILRSHWIGVDTDILREEPRKGLKKGAIEFLVTVFERTDQERSARRFPQVPTPELGSLDENFRIYINLSDNARPSNMRASRGAVPDFVR
jgi:hypothetical protein